MIRCCEYKIYTIRRHIHSQYRWNTFYPHKSIYHFPGEGDSFRNSVTLTGIYPTRFFIVTRSLIGWIRCRGTPWDVPADRWPSVGPRQPVRPCEGGVRVDVGVRRRGWKPATRFGMGDDAVSGHFGRSRATAGQSDRVALDIR